VGFKHKTLPSFWHCYRRAPEEIQRRADKQYELLAENPSHPSVQLKPVGAFWSARVTEDYRALAFREGNSLIWFWLGPHSEYDRLLKG
jgi:hypothetical protein